MNLGEAFLRVHEVCRKTQHFTGYDEQGNVGERCTCGQPWRVGDGYDEHVVPLACAAFEQEGKLPAGGAGLASRLLLDGFAGDWDQLVLVVGQLL